jgi:5'-3' exonuclease, N-terminal resolvase-like domain
MTTNHTAEQESEELSAEASGILDASVAKRKKLVLIDGHALVHRAFHAVPEQLTSRGGEPVNATFGFTSMLMKALSEEKPEYVPSGTSNLLNIRLIDPLCPIT